MDMNAPYVVLIGDVGAGKSTLVEKISGFKGLSSDSCISATRSSTCFPSYDYRLLISDTPGKNPMDEVFEHNIDIAYAMNLKPVSSLVIVAEAHTRMDNTIDNMKKYFGGLYDFKDHLCLCITKMDTVKWSETEFRSIIERKNGAKDIVFSGNESTGESLIEGILSACKSSVKINITMENFWKYFDVSDDNYAIIQSVNKEIHDMVKIKENFFQVFNECESRNDQADMIFEFQAWVREEIINAQKRLSEKHKFSLLSGENLIAECGHIANMTNQLKGILFDIRLMLPAYQESHGLNDVRKCPHCGEVWVKIEGCSGETTCGYKMGTEFDRREGEFFNFIFKRNGNQLEIEKKSKVLERKEFAISEETTEAQVPEKKRPKDQGCGKKIVWSQMPIVNLPDDVIHEEKQTAHTDDVRLYMQEVAADLEKEIEGTLSRRQFLYE